MKHSWPKRVFWLWWLKEGCKREHWSSGYMYNLCLRLTMPPSYWCSHLRPCHGFKRQVKPLTFHFFLRTCVPQRLGFATQLPPQLSLYLWERRKERGRSAERMCAGRSVRGMMYFAAPGLWQRRKLEREKGLLGPRTRDSWKRTTCGKKPENKQFTRAPSESLIITRGILTTDNYSVDLEYLAISYCDRGSCAWPRWCLVCYFE